MTKRVYRTASGKSLDIGRIVLQNENTRAVGNMGVNARGDRVNNQNASIESRPAQVAKNYARQTRRNNVSDEPVADSIAHLEKQEEQTKEVRRAAKEAQKQQRYQEPEETAPAPEKSEPKLELDTSGGLAAAIARSRQVKQEPMKTPRQLRQEAAGVKKI